MERITRMAGVLRWLILAAAVLMALVPVVLGLMLLGVDIPVVDVRLGADGAVSDLPLRLAVIGPALYGGLLAYGLLRLSEMMRTIRAEGPLTAGPVGHLKEFARFWLLSMIVNGLWPMAARLLHGAWTGSPVDLALKIEVTGAISILVALCLFLVVRLLDEARRVAEEYGQII